MKGLLIATIHRQSDTNEQNRYATAKSLILVLYFTWVYASFHPSHSDSAANVILLRKRLDARILGSSTLWYRTIWMVPSQLVCSCIAKLLHVISGVE